MTSSSQSFGGVSRGLRRARPPRTGGRFPGGDPVFGGVRTGSVFSGPVFSGPVRADEKTAAPVPSAGPRHGCRTETVARPCIRARVLHVLRRTVRSGSGERSGPVPVPSAGPVRSFPVRSCPVRTGRTRRPPHPVPSAGRGHGCRTETVSPPCIRARVLQVLRRTVPSAGPGHGCRTETVSWPCIRARVLQTVEAWPAHGRSRPVPDRIPVPDPVRRCPTGPRPRPDPGGRQRRCGEIAVPKVSAVRRTTCSGASAQMSALKISTSMSRSYPVSITARVSEPKSITPSPV